VTSRVRSALELEANIPSAWLFVHQTVKSLAKRVSDDLLASRNAPSAALLPTVSTQLAKLGSSAPSRLSYQQVGGTRHLLLHPLAHSELRVICTNKDLGWLGCHGLSMLYWCAVQEQFVQLWQQDPSSGVYNVPWAVRLHGNLDTAALQAAVQLVAERHLVSCSDSIPIFADCHPAITILMQWRA
jgi:hypothetical protein